MVRQCGARVCLSDFISPDFESDKGVGPEGRAYRNVNRVTTSCHQHSPDSRNVVAGIECVPASSEVHFEPGGEVHWTVGRRYAYVAEIASAIACWNIHAATQGDGKMGKIAADAAPFIECFPCRPG